MESIVALDVGEVRIGIASARTEVRLAYPLATYVNDEHFTERLKLLLGQEQAVQLVVGLPRGLNGQTTAQTEYVVDFVRSLQQEITVPISFQDEALTSRKAEAELKARKKPFEKGDVDALAATYILEDYLGSQRSVAA